jgi:formylglycine-generating enzyme required for sulfatase activity
MIQSRQPVSNSADGGIRLTWTVLTFLVVGSVVPSAIAADAAHASDDVPSGYRVALLLGNSTYEGFTLDGVGKSLDQVEQALKTQGFRVMRRENIGQMDLKATVLEFAKTVPSNGVALVYYAGLGAHVERQGRWYNLLRPVGEKIESDNDYRSRGLSATDLIKSLREQSGSRVNLLFLDACWESPIRPEKGNVNGGLHGFKVDADTMVMFAARSEQTVPIPASNAPSALAIALAKNAGRLDGSVKGACESIAAGTGNPWFDGATEAGIGKCSAFPVTDTIRDGKTPGEGFANSIGMTFRWCPPGRFTMGSENSESAVTSDRKPVQVVLSKGLWMGEHEVTQREYNVVMRKTVPPGFTVHKNAPFWGVGESKQITDFCKKLNDLERKVGTLPRGWEYVCPTEAEWECACRAGSTATFCFGDSVAELGSYGNFADKTLRTTNPNYYWGDQRAEDGVAESLALVGSYRPNAWGLCDMHGNVAEVVADHLLPELPGGTDPLVRVEKDGKTQIRGGAWCSLALYCESSFRNASPGRDKRNFIGFRVVLKKTK